MTTVELTKTLGALRRNASNLPTEGKNALAALERSFSSANPDFSKTEAADLLEVSQATLDKWISNGLIPTVKGAGQARTRIPAEPLRLIADEISQLREMGRKRGLLDEALLRLEQEEPGWRKQFAELYGPAFDARKAGDDLVSAAPGSDWGPND